MELEQRYSIPSFAMTEVSHWVVNSSALPTEHVGRADANVYREP